ncbi:MAG: c-type cytochrome [Pseudomonadota bacterium]
MALSILVGLRGQRRVHRMAFCVLVFGAALCGLTPVSAQELLAPGDHPCRRPGTEKIATYELAPGRTLARSIPQSLTGAPGNALRGRGLMVAPERGNCTSCHAVADIRKKARQADSTSVERFGLQGTLGPALDGVGTKLTEGELRLWIVNPQLAQPQANSIMPAYHDISGRKRPFAGCEKRALLTAGEVEDIVAYMQTLAGDNQ